MEEPRGLTSILGELLAEKVQFVLVGALAAVAQGAPLTTHDVDIVHLAGCTASLRATE